MGLDPKIATFPSKTSILGGEYADNSPNPCVFSGVRYMFRYKIINSHAFFGTSQRPAGTWPVLSRRAAWLTKKKSPALVGKKTMFSIVLLICSRIILIIILNDKLG